MKTSKVLKYLIRFLIILASLLLIMYLNRGRIGKYLATKHFAKLEQESLAEPFIGLTTSFGKEDGLFDIKSTGISTEGIMLKATAFIDNLTEKQRERTLYPIDDEEWRKWCNVDNGIYKRQGVSLKEMDENQKEAAFALMQESLSAKGLQLSKDIMKTDHTLKEIHNGSEDYDEELYFFTIMGEPSRSEPWGWQIDGHHLIINYFVLGDQVVMSPVFTGGEPIFTTSGKYKGNVLFQDEQNTGLAFMQSLSKEEQSVALIDTIKGRNSIQAEANSDNVVLDYQGIKIATLDSIKQNTLIKLIELYLNNIREGHKEVRMEEVIEHINDTYFAWVGKTDDEAVFYYRIHSPVVLIEFDHQGPVGVPSADRGPSRNHIHTILRTPNGNDYGKDLLRQHLEAHH